LGKEGVGKMAIPGNNLAGARTNRSPLDCYSTPYYATKALMERVKFDGEVWECACGSGKMARVIENYNPVIETDIQTGTDFLLESRVADNIITNPPYNLAERFVWQALRLSHKKVALFLRLNFLESSGRYNMFKTTPLKQVLVFSKRQNLYPDGYKIPQNGGTIAYAWFIWEKNYTGQPAIDWIND
jgi:hypothetical protein